MLSPYLTHFYTKSGHHHWIRFANSQEDAEQSVKETLNREYPEGFDWQKTEPCDDPSAVYPTIFELNLAGLYGHHLYVGPLEFDYATALACDLRQTGHFGDIEIIKHGRKYNLVELR